jgi:hypothetical protein
MGYPASFSPNRLSSRANEDAIVPFFFCKRVFKASSPDYVNNPASKSLKILLSTHCVALNFGFGAAAHRKIPLPRPPR